MILLRPLGFKVGGKKGWGGLTSNGGEWSCPNKSPQWCTQILTNSAKIVIENSFQLWHNRSMVIFAYTQKLNSFNRVNLVTPLVGISHISCSMQHAITPLVRWIHICANSISWYYKPISFESMNHVYYIDNQINSNFSSILLHVMNKFLPLSTTSQNELYELYTFISQRIVHHA